jgi:UPF0755 protein
VKRATPIIGLLIAALCVSGFALLRTVQTYARTPGGGNTEERIVVVVPGQPLSATVKALEREGVIRTPFLFTLYARLDGRDRRIKAGEYALRASLSPQEILAIMEKGAVKLYRLTVPEGLNLHQTAELIAKSGLAGLQDVLAAAADPAAASRLGVAAPTLEGYLYPDTYFFPRGVSAADIVEAMVKRFRAVFSPQWEQRAAEIGFSVHEVVTLASIIEKETAVAGERPLISSVFHNRLKRGMRLETDPTVIYGIKDFDGNLTRRHLETPTPYNTYIIKGLPPGPIASPGAATLKAALFPAETDYLFFVSRNNGSHEFSTTLADHNRAVRTYQLRRP